MHARILIIDDEDGIRFSLRGILEDEGFEVLEAPSGEDGLALLARETPDLVFLDIWMPGMDGLAVLDQLHAQRPDLPVIMISGHGTIETAVNAIRKGAHDFIEKPLSLEKVLIAAQRALEYGDLRRENEALRDSLPTAHADEMNGRSPVMETLRGQIARVAPTDAWVLITGENGTGKELAARAIHAGSRRADRPLVAVNCAAIPEELIESELFGHEKGAFTGADSAKAGKFEMAHKGTLFLDEIGDMSLKTQAKILRILQEQQFERVGGHRTMRVDVRVIAATNKNLEDEIAAGTFREDLYYRLRVFPLVLPPLREREGDVPLLIELFAQRLARDYGVRPATFAPDAQEALARYPWPGNVRELRNFVERMLILHAGLEVTRSMLPPEFLPRSGAGMNGSAGAATAAGGRAASGTGATTGQGGDPLPDHLPDMAALLAPGMDLKAARAAFEAQYLAARLAECGGNVTRLAEAVGIERSHLYRKLKGYNIQTTD
ncbi:sigma-54-dependent transcriptional regulator [Nitratidesulfovibrio sp. SRB-5]|uniref:sigma-54-dependent transcriptional regulator n=1 Tax=Nitratidesulfovibrio sp. SRB-5 TaxID=2872636 RepID=UPI001027CAFE|nr:sigma-54 dependent transcriptional regulator [Nitratidesulfovibrio sp. SRB-5]MBZ2172383.1 sigma-54 dependent transcriptional regulator [Nitratidesulfovibrio sp. SRB-5]RXF76995.1 sigma-54-dependent Fis family transcriptional regulator [Desulfovibrio sp. DS-1]